jgi:hypothetical protein
MKIGWNWGADRGPFLTLHLAPRGQLRPWGSKFAPRGELRMGLRGKGARRKLCAHYIGASHLFFQQAQNPVLKNALFWKWLKSFNTNPAKVQGCYDLLGTL